MVQADDLFELATERGVVDIERFDFVIDEISGEPRRISIPKNSNANLKTSDLPGAPPPKEGQVGRYSTAYAGIFTIWKPSRMVLKNAQLTWFNAEQNEEAVLLGSLNFNLYKCEVEQEGLQFNIKAFGRDEKIKFKVDSENDAAEWVESIRLHIANSEGHLREVKAPSQIEFWKREQLNEQQFKDMADTFDILLFTCRTTSAAVQRTFTSGEFDHAALVLRFGSDPNDVFFLEASHNENIQVRSFELMKEDIGPFYKQIALRPLRWERTD